jgi:N-acetylneuraminic acid mutarotase
MPTDACRCGVISAVFDQRIYVLDAGSTEMYRFHHIGAPDGASRKLYRFDPESNTWAALAPAPFPRGPAFAALADRICAFGGGHGVSRSTHAFLETYCYVPATDAWELGPRLPYHGTQGGMNSAPRAVGIAAVGYEGAIYAFGGGAWGYANDYHVTDRAVRLATH